MRFSNLLAIALITFHLGIIIHATGPTVEGTSSGETSKSDPSVGRWRGSGLERLKERAAQLNAATQNPTVRQDGSFRETQTSTHLPNASQEGPPVDTRTTSYTNPVHDSVFKRRMVDDRIQPEQRFKLATGATRTLNGRTSCNIDRNSYQGRLVTSLEDWCRLKYSHLPNDNDGDSKSKDNSNPSMALPVTNLSVEDDSRDNWSDSDDAYWTKTDLNKRLPFSAEHVLSYRAERECFFIASWAWTDYGVRDVKSIFERVLLPEDTPLPIYKPPTTPLTLTRLPAKFIRYGPMTLAPLLLAARRTQVSQYLAQGTGSKRTDIRPVWETVDIVTQRGNLRMLAGDVGMWDIAAQKVGNTLFLRRFIQRRGTNVNVIGFQFERECLDPSSSSQSTRGTLTETDSEVRSSMLVTKGTIGKYKILLESEIDAVAVPDCFRGAKSPTIPLDQLEFIELKTRSSSNSDDNRMWLQSKLAGMDRIVCGMRESGKDHIVKSLDECHPDEIIPDSNSIIFARIEQALEFLVENVKKKWVYVFRTEEQENPVDKNNRYRKVLRKIENRHSFVNKKMLREVEETYPLPL